ncbi:MAG: TIGR04086 family membrane protein [Solirubrobacterales bacterium]
MYHLVDFRGLLAAIVIALILGLAVTGVVYCSPLQENILYPLADLSLIASVFCGGALSAGRHGNRGLLRGAVLGLTFFLVTLAAWLVFSPETIELAAILKKLAFTCAAGALGGICGVSFFGE